MDLGLYHLYYCKETLYYRPQTKFAKVMFLQVSVCPQGGMHGCGGDAWLLQGGMHGCSQGGHAWLLPGACMVAPGGHAWLLLGGVHGCSWGVCMAKGGMCGEGGRACMVKGACVAKGGMHGEGSMRGEGGVCVAKGGMCGKGGHAWQRGGMCGMHGRSLRGRYASYWNAFLLQL